MLAVVFVCHNKRKIGVIRTILRVRLLREGERSPNLARTKTKRDERTELGGLKNGWHKFEGGWFQFWKKFDFSPNKRQFSASSLGSSIESPSRIMLDTRTIVVTARLTIPFKLSGP